MIVLMAGVMDGRDFYGAGAVLRRTEKPEIMGYEAEGGYQCL